MTQAPVVSSRPAISQLRTELRAQLQAVAADSAGLEADLLLMDILGCSRARLLTADDEQLTDDQNQRLAQMLSRRINGEPMAYILGTREFWSLELAVTPATLIPRADTERLVEIALQTVTNKNAKVADMGTGSGAIALALASERAQWQLVATDASQAALDVAISNASHLGIANIQFRHGEWFAPLTGERFDLIISNPPYVAEGDPCLSQGDTCREPLSALSAGAEGLDDLRHLVATAAGFLVPGGSLLLEHGYDQQAALVDLLNTAGWQQITCFQDLAGLDRCVLAMAE